MLKVAAPLLVIAVGFGTVQALHAAKPEPEKKEEVDRPVSLYVDEVRRESVTLSVNTQGEVKAKNEIDLIPQVTGRIVSVSDSFSAGGQFDANTVLIKIDDADYKLAVTRAEARVAESRVYLEQELADAAIKAKQWEEWVQDGEPTPLALNKPQVAEAQAKVRAAEADLADARLDLARTEIKVPFTGRVKMRNVGIGQLVNSGTVLGRVFSTDTVEVKLPLTDTQLADLQLPIGYVAEKGMAPAVTLQARVGGKAHTWAGNIVRTHAAIDNETRLVYAVAEVKDPYGTAASAEGMPLAVGLFVTADIAGVQAQDTLAVSRLGLRAKDTVYVIEDGKLAIRKVNLLSTTHERMFITAGLNEGDQVVTSPLTAPTEGMAVQPITRSAGSLPVIAQ